MIRRQSAFENRFRDAYACLLADCRDAANAPADYALETSFMGSSILLLGNGAVADHLIAEITISDKTTVVVGTPRQVTAECCRLVHASMRGTNATD